MIIKLHYIIITLLAGVAFVLGINILSLNQIPDRNTLDLHLGSVSNAVQKMDSGCQQRYAMIKLAGEKSQNPQIIRANKIADHLMAFQDSAKFYLQTILSSKNDQNLAKYYFLKYSLFSKRYSKYLRDSVRLDRENYLLKIEEKLPGKQLPFTSSEGVEILTKLLEAECYETLEEALFKIVN